MAIARLIASARESVELMVFVATPASPRSSLVFSRLWQELQNAPPRNVRCRALFAAATKTSSQGITNARVASRLATAGWHCRRAGGAQIIHAKIWIFDGERAVIGSHNMTEAGMMRNIEFSLLIHQPQVVERLLHQFNNHWERAREDL